MEEEVLDPEDAITEGELESSFSAALSGTLSDAPLEEPAEPSEPPQVTHSQDAPPVASDDPPADDVPSGFDVLVDNARRLGISTDGMSSEAELAKAVMDQMEQMQPMVGYAQQLAPHADKIQAYLASQAVNPDAKQAQAETSPNPEKEQWDPAKYLQDKYGGPDWKQTYQQAIDSGMVTRDVDTGLWTSTPGYEVMVSSILPELNAAEKHTSGFWQRLSRANPYQDFYSVLKEPFMREVKDEIRRYIESRETSQQIEDEVGSFIQSKSDIVYKVDPSTGSQVLSDVGIDLVDTLNQLRESGVTDHSVLLKISKWKLGEGAAQPPAAVSSPPQPPAAVPQPVSQSPQQSFLDAARERAAHSPSASLTSDASAPQVETEGDLESMFSRAFRQASHN